MPVTGLNGRDPGCEWSGGGHSGTKGLSRGGLCVGRVARLLPSPGRLQATAPSSPLIGQGCLLPWEALPRTSGATLRPLHMPITELSLRNYRSLRDVRLSLGRLTVVTGPNGSGKSNLYRALWLLAQIAEGGFARALCQEGGLASALWAGPRRSKDPWRMSLGFRTDQLSFQLDCGFPIPGNTLFGYDPQIKEEAVWLGKVRRPSTTLVDRRGGMAKLRDPEGETVEYPAALTENESILSQLREPQRFPELYSLRDEMRQWRFYHAFRTDAEAPVRTPQISVRTPVLSHDGSDLAAALQTIRQSTGPPFVCQAAQVDSAHSRIPPQFYRRRWLASGCASIRFGNCPLKRLMQAGVQYSSRSVSTAEPDSRSRMTAPRPAHPVNSPQVGDRPMSCQRFPG